MNRIEVFLNKFDRDLNLDPDEIKEMKEEMRIHLIDYVKEAQLRGLTEQQAISEALEHFGDESQIRRDFILSFPKKINNFLFVISLVLLISSLLVPIGHYAFLRFYEVEREGLLRSLENTLSFTEYQPQELKKEVDGAIESQTIKDILIEDHPSKNDVYRTIDNEGFGQDDSFWIDTMVKNHILGSGDKVYYITYSYNIFTKSWLLSIILFVSYWLLFPFWFFKNYRDNRWTTLILVTNFFGYWAFKRMNLKNIKE